MARVLFINRGFAGADFGGARVSQRNFEIISGFCEVEPFDAKYIWSDASLMKKSVKMVLAGNYIFIKREIKEIYKKIRTGGFDVIFIDASYIGMFARYAKRHSSARVVVFFHNTEVHNFVCTKSTGNEFNFGIFTRLQRMICKRFCIKNERAALKFADKIILLNARDMVDLGRYYPREMRRIDKAKFSIIPISLRDDMTEADVTKAKAEATHTPPLGLFIGAFFPPNIEGLDWFVKNVAGRTDARYVFAGKDLDKVAAQLAAPNVTVLGRQADLKAVYMDADFALSPLFSGSGMKTKTVEAMMYGKTIFATDEGFSGFEADFERVGARANTAEEFVKAINDFATKGRKFNEYSRKVYLEGYSNEAVADKFKAVLCGDC